MNPFLTYFNSTNQNNHKYLQPLPSPNSTMTLPLPLIPLPPSPHLLSRVILFPFIDHLHPLFGPFSLNLNCLLNHKKSKHVCIKSNTKKS